MQTDKERVKLLLKDTITLLCKNGLTFENKFCVDAVIGVTVDEQDVFYVSINEQVKSEKFSEATSTVLSASEQSPSDLEDRISKPSGKHHHRRRKRIKQSSFSDETLGERATDLDEGHSSPSKRHCVKEEQEQSDGESNDIVFVKEEPQDSWGHSKEAQSGNQSFGDMSFPSDSMQDQNFASLSGMNLVPLESDQASHVWSQGMPSQMPGPVGMSVQRTSTVTSQEAEESEQISRPFGQTCSTCNKFYTRKYELKRHQERHLGIYPHNCPTCNKGFTSIATLKGHMSWHTGVKAHACDFCSKSFRYRQGLKEHMTVFHKDCM